MLTLKNFCFCCDLRRGCVTYAWLQMMFVTVVGTKFAWLQDLFNHSFSLHHSYVMLISVQLSLMIGLQIIKGVSSAALIWGVIKKNHMYYQPWLFINGLENVILVIATLISFVVGCIDPYYFIYLPGFAIFAAFGWYFWSCVFVVYRRDMRPNVIGFDSQYENFNMNNINVTV